MKNTSRHFKRSLLAFGLVAALPLGASAYSLSLTSTVIDPGFGTIPADNGVDSQLLSGNKVDELTGFVDTVTAEDWDKDMEQTGVVDFRTFGDITDIKPGSRIRLDLDFQMDLTGGQVNVTASSLFFVNGGGSFASAVFSDSYNESQTVHMTLFSNSLDDGGSSGSWNQRLFFSWGLFDPGDTMSFKILSNRFSIEEPVPEPATFLGLLPAFSVFLLRRKI